MFSQTTWTILPSNTTSHLSDITFLSTTHGFIVGENDTVLKTTDTRSTWYSVFAASWDYFKSVSFYDDTTGFVISNQNLYTTTDGGNNWSLVYTSETSSLNVVFFVTPNMGFIGTDVSILKTIDGSQNWLSQSVANPINSITFPNPTKGYFVGGIDVSSLLYKTDNQGLT